MKNSKIVQLSKDDIKYLRLLEKEPIDLVRRVTEIHDKALMLEPTIENLAILDELSVELDMIRYSIVQRN